MSKGLTLDKFQRKCEGYVYRFTSEMINMVKEQNLPPLDIVIGNNNKVRKIFESINNLKDSNSNVLILGEYGTGKGVLARAIHERSNRKDLPFYSINYSFWPDYDFEVKLFGWDWKTAFFNHRGPDLFQYNPKSAWGLFDDVKGGTILLEDVRCMGETLQNKFVRITQEGIFERVEGSGKIKTDARIMATITSKINKESVQDYLFKKGFHFIIFELPPLRERREDIAAFTKFFMQKYCKEYQKPGLELHKDVLDVLQNYAYPGNISELECKIQAVVVLAKGKTIHRDDLGHFVRP